MLQRDYFIDETQNGYVNGVPAGIANQQANNLFDQMRMSEILQQQGYRDPRSFMEAVYMIFNNGRAPKQKEQRRQIFPNAIGF